MKVIIRQKDLISERDGGDVAVDARVNVEIINRINGLIRETDGKALSPIGILEGVNDDDEIAALIDHDEDFANDLHDINDFLTVIPNHLLVKAMQKHNNGVLMEVTLDESES